MAPLKWKPLPAFDGTPALLASPDFGSTSYTVHITDLANVWVETLDRKGIGKRALNEDTSIDPTEGPDQMIMLLTKLQAAFDPSAPDHSQTSLTLAASSDGDEGSLALNITCLLPGGLKPLHWPFQFRKCPPPAVASELVLPLVQAQYCRAREINSLIISLRDKDAIIDRLVDKLEAAGVGLDNVFNSLSGKRKVSRQLAEEKVKGLAPFKEFEWRSNSLPDGDRPIDTISLFEDVFSKPIHCEDMGIGASDDLKDWWTKLGTKPIAAVRSERKPDVVEASQTRESDPVADEGDDFQIQATPPRLASKRKGHTAVDDDATTDDDEAGADTIPDSLPGASHQTVPRLGSLQKRKDAGPSPAPRPSPPNQADPDATASESDTEPVQSPPRRKPAARLGKVGRASKPVEPPAKSPSPIPQDPKDDDTASGSDDDAVKAASPVPSKDPPVPKRKLGSLGRPGRDKQKSDSPADNESGDASKPDEATATAPIPTRKKLGAIGKRKVEEKGAESAASKEAPAEPETEEQKAGRKRADLAKELERKAAAAPAKKKRKF